MVAAAIAFSVDGARTATTLLSHNLSVREQYVVERHAYTDLSEIGLPAFVPLPIRIDVLQEQRLLRGDRVIWTGGAELDVLRRRFHVSPNGATVVVEAKGFMKPWQLVDTASGRALIVSAPDIEGHAYVYPLVFERWLPDSSAAVAKAEGSFIRGSGVIEFHEVWLVDAATGAPRRLEHVEES